MGLPVDVSLGYPFTISPSTPGAPCPRILELENAGAKREALLNRGSEDGLFKVTQTSMAKPEPAPESCCQGDAMPYPSHTADRHSMAKAGHMSCPGVTALYHVLPQVLTLRQCLGILGRLTSKLSSGT